MSGQTVASPVPSSGENTPLTAKAPGQLSQSIQHDPQRMGSHHSSFASITNQNRNSLPQMPHTSQIDPNNFDWAAFQSNQRASVMGGQFNASEQTVSIKNEGQRSKSHFDSIPDGQHDDLISGLFETSRGGPVGGDSLNGWNLPDSYQAKADRLMILCQLDGPSDPDDALLRYVLTPDNIDHFVQSFTNCHVHWPTLHLPTFNPADANDGLLLAVICIGAVYSERVSISQVRTLMKRFKRAIEQSSQVLAYLEDSTNEAEISQPTDSAFYDELTALVIIDAQAIWHGENEHRQNVINEFGRYVTVARRLRLFEPAPPGSPNFSILHQPGSQEHISMEEWDWSSWIWQERQVRFVYVLFLSAVALVLYFNSPSVKLSSLEIKLPLPSDDATFEAPTPSECALALGFHGPTSQGFNVSGSGRKKQPELNSALRALQHPSYEFASKSTNAYSKFILVHAVHLQLFKAQKQLSSQAIDLSLTNDFSFCGVSHFDWITQGDRDLGGSANTSGHATPDGNTSPRVQQFLKTIHTSLDKWKRMWDDDLPLQYPPGTSRVGFCRDPIHFYWLARMILQKPLSADWQWPPMQKFASVMTMLKQVKNWVNNDSASRGEVSGSVGAIDESYGIGDLTHDMKLLFTPVSPEFSSPSATSNSGGLSVMEQHGSWPPNFSG